MNDPIQLQVRSSLIKAGSALKNNDRMEARRWATYAIKLAPDTETAWLILGAVASPKASVAYIQKAMDINPKSDRAIKGMEWALRRVQQQRDPNGSIDVHTSKRDTQLVIPRLETSRKVPSETKIEIKPLIPSVPSIESLKREKVSGWKRALKSKSFMFGLIVILVFGLMAIFAPLLAPFDPYKRGWTNTDLPPFWVQNRIPAGIIDHPFGTDRWGQDILSRYLFGIRTAFVIAICSIPLTALTGTLIGLFSGYLGRKFDSIMTTIMDVLQSLPGIMFVVITILIMRKILSPTWLNGCIILVIGYSTIGWVGLARLVRINVLQIKNLLYVEAATAIGASPWRILSKHIFPNVSHLVMVWIVNNIPAIILLEAILGYIGVDIIQPLTEKNFSVISWGGLFYTGRSTLSSNPAIMLLPALSLLLVSMSFILIGDYLHKHFSN
jgi:peptide/nickel transport system permease protein